MTILHYTTGADIPPNGDQGSTGRAPTANLQAGDIGSNSIKSHLFSELTCFYPDCSDSNSPQERKNALIARDSTIKLQRRATKFLRQVPIDNFTNHDNDHIKLRFMTIVYLVVAYLKLHCIHLKLGYPDLACGDAYRGVVCSEKAKEIISELSSLRDGDQTDLHSDEEENKHEKGDIAMIIEDAESLKKISGEADTIEEQDLLGVEDEGSEKEQIDDERLEDALQSGFGEILRHGLFEAVNLMFGQNKLMRFKEEVVVDANKSMAEFREDLLEVLDILDRLALYALVTSLVTSGCHSDADTYCLQAQSKFWDDHFLCGKVEFEFWKRLNEKRIHGSPSSTKIDGGENGRRKIVRGLSRREVYPWNHYEPDRFSEKFIKKVNKRLKECCVGIDTDTGDGEAGNPWIQAKVLELPVLSYNGQKSTTPTEIKATKQLGVFAARDIPSSLPFPYISEFSPLISFTCLNPSSAVLCDTCSTVIGDPDDGLEIIYCLECLQEDITTAFCSEKCYSVAQKLYHPVLCGKDWGWLHRDIHSKSTIICQPFSSGSVISRGIEGYESGASNQNNKPSETPPSPSFMHAEDDSAIYSLLLLKALAMALKCNKHPLRMMEISWLYGAGSRRINAEDGALYPDYHVSSVPFSFHHHVVIPQMIMESLGMELIPSTALTMITTTDASTPSSYLCDSTHYFDTWVVITILNKFKGVASLTTRPYPSGSHPHATEIIIPAVHPMYSLNNHDCDPNVYWAVSEETGSMEFWVLDERDKFWRKGEEKKGVINPEDSKKVDEGKMVEQEIEIPVTVLKNGIEIRSSYVDPGLGFRERQRNMWGTLGGKCRCERCVREEQDEKESEGIRS